MTPAHSLRLTVDPVLPWLSTMGVNSDIRVQVMLLAVQGQESGFKHRVQVGGPAGGGWQFVKAGDVAAVLSHSATKVLAARCCAELLLPATSLAVHEAFAQNDALACVFARLLLLSGPASLSGVDQPAVGWNYVPADLAGRKAAPCGVGGVVAGCPGGGGPVARALYSTWIAGNASQLPLSERSVCPSRQLKRTKGALCDPEPVSTRPRAVGLE